MNNPDGIFGLTDPGLPGRVRRDPLDASGARSPRFIDPNNPKSAPRARPRPGSYQPLDRDDGGGASSLLDGNKYRFLCHDQDGTRAAGDLPTIKLTRILTRWLGRGEFAPVRTIS